MNIRAAYIEVIRLRIAVLDAQLKLLQPRKGLTMGHWRDGGIGNMAGSDDRPIEEWTLLEKLACIAGGSGQAPIADTCQEAFDEIQRMHIERTWQPIETAPVEEWSESQPSYYRFKCLLQNERREVFQGYGYYVVKAARTGRLVYLRWNDGRHQCFPKYWMPLPAAKED